MKQIIILVTIILSLHSASNAEIWKCQKVGEQAASYTDTPTGGDGINCEKVETIRFSNTGNNAARTTAPAKSYSAPPPQHTITKVKARIKSSTPKSAPEPKKSSSGSGKGGGNHPSGVNSK